MGWGGWGGRGEGEGEEGGEGGWGGRGGGGRGRERVPCTLSLEGVHVHDGTYRVILRIVKAGCHPMAIAQVVEH